jgi:hypothetical protein
VTPTQLGNRRGNETRRKGGKHRCWRDGRSSTGGGTPSEVEGRSRSNGRKNPTWWPNRGGMVAQQRRNPTGELNRSANQTSQGRIQKSTSRKKNYYYHPEKTKTWRRERRNSGDTNARKEMPVKKGTLWWMTYMRCA